jgi:hypothetical protein
MRKAGVKYMNHERQRDTPAAADREIPFPVDGRIVLRTTESPSNTMKVATRMYSNTLRECGGKCLVEGVGAGLVEIVEVAEVVGVSVVELVMVETFSSIMEFATMMYSKS